MRISEVKLRHVSVQVPLRGVLIDTAHAAFKNAKVILDVVGRYFRIAAPYIFVLAVIYRLVVGKHLTRSDISRSLVRQQSSLLGDVGAQDRRDIGYGQAIDHEATRPAAGTVD